MDSKPHDRLLALREMICRFCGSERKVFLLAFLLCSLLSVLSLLFTYDIYRDVANVYAYYAREMGRGNWTGFWVGRVPMLQILLAGTLALAGMEAFHANIFVSCMFYTLTLFPLRGFLKQFLSPIQAAWGCVLFAAAPKLIRFSVSGMIDAGRYFFLIAALYLLFRLKERLSGKDVCLFGLSLAGLAVSRGEELPFSLMLLLLLPVISWSGKERFAWRPRLKAMLAAAVIFLIGITPFCAANLHFYGAFVPDLRLAGMLYRGWDPANSAENFSPKVPTEKKSRPAEEFCDTVTNTFRGGYEPYLVLAMIGGFLLIRRRQWDRRHTLLIVLFLLHGIIYFKVGSAYRYSIYLSPLFMPLTVGGASFLLDLYRCTPIPGKYRPGTDVLLGGAAAVVLLLQVVNGMDCVFSRGDRWLRENAAFIKAWGEENIVGRPLRLVCVELPETVYWSGAYSVFNYNFGKRDLRIFRDFDLLLIPESRLSELGGRSDLIEMKLPRMSSSPSSKKRFRLFRLNPESAAEAPKHVRL